jgi:phosphoribosyl 1,2-cyclic phosphodiesterase
MLLFHHDLVVAPLGSGSRGNCTYVGDGRHGVLIDCGLSTKQIFARLDEMGLRGVPIDAVLITHEHSDHVGAAGVLDRRLETDRLTPFFLTEGTRSRLPAKLTPRSTRTVVAGQTFAIGGILVEPVAIPHDTPEPVAYALDFGGTRVAIVTDLGKPTRPVERLVAESDVAILEFNHDPDMLWDGPYPWALKQRIAGDRGHLSNAQGAELLQRACGHRLKTVVLAHLSQENNRPELAYRAAEAAIHTAGARVVLHVAEQDRPLALRPNPPVAAAG